MFQINNKDISGTVGRFLKWAIKTTDWYLPEVTVGGVLQKNVSWNTLKNSFENNSIGALSLDNVAGLQLFLFSNRSYAYNFIKKEAPTQMLS